MWGPLNSYLDMQGFAHARLTFHRSAGAPARAQIARRRALDVHVGRRRAADRQTSVRRSPVEVSVSGDRGGGEWPVGWSAWRGRTGGWPYPWWPIRRPSELRVRTSSLTNVHPITSSSVFTRSLRNCTCVLMRSDSENIWSCSADFEA